MSCSDQLKSATIRKYRCRTIMKVLILMFILMTCIYHLGKSCAPQTLKTPVQHLCGYRVVWNATHFSNKDITDLDRIPKSLPMSCNHCFARQFRRRHDPHSTCRLWPGQEEDVLDVVFVIPSKPADVEGRLRLRKNWLSITLANRASHYRHLFVLGSASNDGTQKAIDTEQIRYKDILQREMPEGFHNLTLKTLEGLEWVSLHCRRARYAMKVDMDTFLDIVAFKSVISNLPAEVSLCGRCKFHNWVTSIPEHPLYIPYSKYPSSAIAPYCFGGGYIITLPAVREVLRVAPDLPQIGVEDVFVGWSLRESRFRGNLEYRVHDVSNFMKITNRSSCEELDCKRLHTSVVWHKSRIFLNCAWEMCYKDTCFIRDWLLASQGNL